MALGTNIGMTKMAEVTPAISYKQMANATQWRLYEDAMSKEQSVLVNSNINYLFPHIGGEMEQHLHQTDCVYN